MASILGDSLRGLDALAEQFEARRQTLKKMGRSPSEEVRKEWRFHEDKGRELMLRLAREENKPFWSQGPQLLDRIDDLFDNIDGQFAAPTTAQMELLEKLETEFAEGVAALNSWLSTDLPKMNRMLEAEGVPAVALPEAVGQGTM
jgi:hypothetical protein